MIDKTKMEDIKKEIAQALSQEDKAERISYFFDEMLTESELSNLAMRWELMKRMLEGQSQRHIAEDLSLSLCKITRGSRLLKNKDSVVRGYLLEVVKESRLADSTCIETSASDSMVDDGH